MVLMWGQYSILNHSLYMNWVLGRIGTNATEWVRPLTSDQKPKSHRRKLTPRYPSYLFKCANSYPKPGVSSII